MPEFKMPNWNNAQMKKCPNETNALMRKCPNEKMLKYENAQMKHSQKANSHMKCSQMKLYPN